MTPSLSISPLGRFATHHGLAILFISAALCALGAFCARTMPSSVFPQTDFPRVVVLVDNGVTPGDEMMATITRPIEEAMKDIPGAVTVRSNTGRGSAEINVFFNWRVDMVQSELYVLGRLAQIRSNLPASATTSVWRLTFSAFPIIGISLTSPTQDLTRLWETARYELKPRFLRVPGVARVDIVGGHAPEYHVTLTPEKLLSARLTISDVKTALEHSNVISPAGMHEENYKLYLTTVDGRVRDQDEIGALALTNREGHLFRIKDIAKIERGPEPGFNVVTAEGVNAVLLNVRSQPDGSTLEIAHALKEELAKLQKELPGDTKLAFFYDQSELVRASVDSVWEAMGFGLVLSVLIIYLFLKDIGTTLTAIVVIPVTVLITLVAMKLLHMSFNLMTLGGIAAAIGLIIDDAIVVVEAIYAKVAEGHPRREAIQIGITEIFRPLVSSTLTPVVVFLPLTFLEGLAGTFFRALAITMVVALLSSLILAVTLTPALAAWLLRRSAPLRKDNQLSSDEVSGGRLWRGLLRVYDSSIRTAFGWKWLTLLACFGVLAIGWGIYQKLDSDFLPAMDEGGFVIDYKAPPGTSLSETSRQLLQAEAILKATPEVESYSRRTGARLALAIAEPHTGDFLVKLKQRRTRSSDDVIAEVRAKIKTIAPAIDWDLHGILGDLIGDLLWAPKPIEIKLFSTDLQWLKKVAPEIEEQIKKISGIVDTFDGLDDTGDSINLKVHHQEAQRYGLTSEDIAAALHAQLLGEVSGAILKGDRLIGIRVMGDKSTIGKVTDLQNIPLRSSHGALLKLSQVAEPMVEPGQVELRREDLRQMVAVTARLEKRDLGSAMSEIKTALAKNGAMPPGVIELGGLYQQQQESFRNLLLVLAGAIVLVFTVLLIEFRSFHEPMAIIFGAVLALSGAVVALWITDTSLNIVSFLGAIIGVGIVAKNGILMLDFVEHLRAKGHPFEEALALSGRRRLRPVLMTSLAAALGMLPLAYGIGSGADMLKPLAISVIGALCISVLLSLVATPTVLLALRGQHVKKCLDRKQEAAPEAS